MSFFDALILGIIQGLTEFLPVSSSGHLAVVQTLLPGFEQQDVLFDLLLHVGTLIAVFIYFRKDLLDMASAWTVNVKHPEYAGTRRLVLGILLGTVPAAFFGVKFEDAITEAFGSSKWVGICWLLIAPVLISVDYLKVRNPVGNNWKWWQALGVGLCQAVALFPGISRSGSTIAGGMFLGWDRAFAARFSFYLSIPAVMGAVVLKLPKLQILLETAQGGLGGYLFGAVVAGVIGYLSIDILLKLVVNRHFAYFGYYLLVIGTATLIFL